MRGESCKDSSVMHTDAVGIVEADLGGISMSAVLSAGPNLSSGHTDELHPT